MQSSLMLNDSAATGLILKDNEPWRFQNSDLYYAFMETMQLHTAEAQIFDTISDYIQHTSDTLDIIREMQSKVQNSQVSREEINLENERNTWRLLNCLYRNRLFAPEADISDFEPESKKYISEKKYLDILYKNEEIIREYQLIIDWLEKNALDQAERTACIEYFTDKTVAWENTLCQLQNTDHQITFSSSRTIVSSLDPDAPIREGKPLHDLDKEDDARLEKKMFIEVRCGRIEKAQSLAMHCGQIWRAACLLGWTPFHDPNYENPLKYTKLPVEGNPNRSLWKLNAWALSEDTRIGKHYRGIYASLCGNIKQMLPLATSWQDALWAHMKGLLDVTIEREIRGFMPKQYTEMPEAYWKNDQSIENIFKELQASNDDFIRAQSAEPSQLIQKYVILNDLPQLMDELNRMLDQDCCDGQFLRFLAHLVLFFRKIGKIKKPRVANKILLSYVKVLMEIGDPTLVAFYTATLPEEDQVTNYAQFLETIKDREKRVRCLQAAEDANLNVKAITKLVVESIRQKNVPMDPSDFRGDLTTLDLEKIDALDWLTFYKTQREEALWQTNALIREFLGCGKIDASRQAFEKVPQDAIELLVSTYPNMTVTMTNHLPIRASKSVREYLCYKAYLDAQESFNEWFTNFHHGKPAPLGELSAYATFTEKVAYDHKKALYKSELERWKTAMQRHTAEVKQLLFNVLLFPDGGWLVDPQAYNVESPPEYIWRSHQLDKLREICIPKVVMLLHTVMSEMNEHAECVKLADIVASKQHRLYKVFSKEKLREFLIKISESSLKLMDQKKDPYGSLK